MKKIIIWVPIIVLIAVGIFIIRPLVMVPADSLYYGEAVGESFVVVSTASGIIESVEVVEGNHLSIGDIVASIEHEDLNYQIELAELEIAKAEELLSKGASPLREEELFILNNAVASIEANGEVIKNSIIKVKLLLDELNVSKAQANNNYLKLQKDYLANATLYEEGVLSQSAIDSSKLQLDSSKAAYDTVVIKYNQTQVELEAFEWQEKMNTLNLDSAKQQLIMAENGLSEHDQNLTALALEQAQTRLGQLLNQLDNYQVRTRQDGVVETIYYSVGEFVGAGTPILTMFDPMLLKVNIYVNESDLKQLTTGQEVKVFEANQTEESITYSAVVSDISDEAIFSPINIVTVKDRERLVYRITIEMERINTIKPGMLMAVDIHGGDMNE